MADKPDLAEVGKRWSGLARILGAIIALAILVLGGGFFYNEIWLSKELVFTILPTYDLGEQAFSGLVIENRGRVPLTDVQAILSQLEAPIEAINIPGTHEPATIANGWQGSTEALIELPRMSRGRSISIYIITSGPVTLAENQTVLVSSAETVGVGSNRSDAQGTLLTSAAIFVGVIGASLSALLIGFYYRSREEPELRGIRGGQ